MSQSSKRRRRRTGSTSARFRPSQLVSVESARPVRIGAVELAACAAVLLVAVTLIALIWMVTDRAVQEQRATVRERAEQSLVGSAAVMAETIAHELRVIDQSLVILQSAWKTDSASVELGKWQKQMPALTAVTDDLFIADERHIIQQDILPQAVGQGVGAAYVSFPHGALEEYGADGTKDRDALVLQAVTTGAAIDARSFLMYVIRPLDHPKGWLIGASYRSEELAKVFAAASPGYSPLVALIDTRRGMLQAVVGPAARRPQTDLSRSALVAEMGRVPNGTWEGTTPIDDVERLHAYHHVPDRDMAVVVGANLADLMAPAENLAAGEHAVALGASALVLAIGGVVLWELYTIRAHRRQKRTMERNRNELDRLRAEEAGTTGRARLNAARLATVMDAATDGIALFDSGLRLVQWNHPFLRGIGVVLVKEMPLDALLREQAAQGLFDATGDIEAEIGRRMGILRSGETAGLVQPGPDGETLVLRGLPVTEGGFMLLLNGLLRWEQAPPPPPSTEIDLPAAAEAPVAVAAPIEW